jgi:hypothetical protein
MTTATVPDPVQRALDAANAHDIEAFLDAFTADGAVDDWGRVFRGREAVRAWSDQEFIGVRVSLRVTGSTERDQQVTVAAQVGGDGFNGPSHVAFTVEGDRISLMRITA